MISHLASGGIVPTVRCSPSKASVKESPTNSSDRQEPAQIILPQSNGNGNGGGFLYKNGTNGALHASADAPAKKRGLSVAIPAKAGDLLRLSAAQMQSQIDDQVARQEALLSGYQANLQDETGAPLRVKTDFQWARDDYNVVQRTIDTWTFIISARLQLALLDKKWSYVGGFTEEKKSQRTRGVAIFIREQILNLGPTFIKLGQLSSTRSDLFAAEYTQELAKLQDRVPAFTFDQACRMIESEVGIPINEIFAEIEEDPIAAASLGQVHRGILKTGEQVVVKIQRPGLKKLFDIDLQNMKTLAKILDAQDENNDFTSIYQECSDILYKEIDYFLEGRNADRFRRNFRTVPWVRAPKVFWQFTTRRVIVQEYLPGTKISNKEKLEEWGLDVKAIAGRATESYLIQILKHGFFHADPHPGNVAVDQQGRLLYYDFGMMGEIQSTVRERLLDVFYGIYRKDEDAVTRALIDLEIVKAASDQLSIKRSIKYFINNINQQAERNETLAAIGDELFAIALDQPIRFPATFTFVLRAFSTLEGVGKTLDDDYVFAQVAQPYAQELLNLEDLQSQEFVIQSLQTQAVQVSRNTISMPERISYMEKLLKEIDSGEYKLRVRVLEAERAARRQSVMQGATLNAVAAVGFVNLTAVLQPVAPTWVALLSMHVAGVFIAFVGEGYRRVKNLDKFEKDLKG